MSNGSTRLARAIANSVQMTNNSSRINSIEGQTRTVTRSANRREPLSTITSSLERWVAALNRRTAGARTGRIAWATRRVSSYSSVIRQEIANRQVMAQTLRIIRLACPELSKEMKVANRLSS